jgi:hypothetical protein
MAASVKHKADYLEKTSNELPKKSIKTALASDEKVEKVATSAIKKEEEEKKVALPNIKLAVPLTDKELASCSFEELVKKYPQTTHITSSNLVFDAKMIEKLSAFGKLYFLSICVRDMEAALALGKLENIKNLTLSFQDQLHPITLPPMKNVETLSIHAKMDDKSIESLVNLPKLIQLTLNSGKNLENQNVFGPRGFYVLLHRLPSLIDLAINISGKPLPKDFLSTIPLAPTKLQYLVLENQKFEMAPLAPWFPCLDRLSHLKTITIKSNAKEAEEKPLTAQMLLFSIIAKFHLLKGLETVIFENSPSEKPDGSIANALSPLALGETYGLMQEGQGAIGKLYSLPRIVVKTMVPEWALAFYDHFFEFGLSKTEAGDFLENVVKNYDAFSGNVSVLSI